MHLYSRTCDKSLETYILSIAIKPCIYFDEEAYTSRFFLYTPAAVLDFFSHSSLISSNNIILRVYRSVSKEFLHKYYLLNIIIYRIK